MQLNRKNPQRRFIVSIQQEVSGYIPKENEEYMNYRQLHYFKNLLLRRREELVSGLKSLRDDLKTAMYKTADPVDIGSAHADIYLDFHASLRHGGAVAEIDTALLKIADGEYGYCEHTGQEIGLRRLMANPTATLCIEAQEICERAQRAQRYGAVPAFV